MREQMAVIFDMDGVIFDTEQLCLKCWKAVGMRHNIIDLDTIALECIGTTIVKTKEILMNHYGKEFAYDAYRKEMSEQFMHEVRKNGMPMKPGIVELLEHLKKERVKIGLGSSTRKVRVEEELKLAKLTQYFDVIVCGDMVTRSKPEPDIFLECAKRLDVAAEHCFVIEDSYNGIRAANRAGMKPIMVPDLLKPNKEMEQLAITIQEDLYQVDHYFFSNSKEFLQLYE